MVVRHPFKILAAFLLLMVSSIVWSLVLLTMKGGILFIPLTDGDLFKDFPKTDAQHYDAMLFWCENCHVLQDPAFEARSSLVVDTLNNMRAENADCGDLKWSGNSKPQEGVPQGFYVSNDQTTTFIEFHSLQMPCMLAVRAQLEEFTVSSGHMLMALGGPESAATASMSAEFLTALCHSVVATPIFSFILWMVTGNVFRAVSPMICVGASYITGKGALGVWKFFSPTLNVNFDDSAVLFIVLALCVDYALFLWTRFHDLRSTFSSPEEYSVVLVAALHKSGMVIVISNLFVSLAWLSGMLLPYMNIWGYLGLYFQAVIACAFSAIYVCTVLPALAAAFPNAFDGQDALAARWHGVIWDNLPSSHDLWLRWSRIVTRKPLMFVILAVAYTFMLLCIIPLTQYKPSFDVQSQGVRRDVIEVKALEQFEKKFHSGMLSPVTIVLTAEPLDQLGDEDNSFTNVALSPEYGGLFCEFAEQVMLATKGKDCEVDADDMLGLWWVPRPRLFGLLTPGDNGCAADFPRIRWLYEEYESVPNPFSEMPEDLVGRVPAVLKDSLSKDGRQMELQVMTKFRASGPESYHLNEIMAELVATFHTSFETGGRRYALSVDYASAMQVQVEASLGLMHACPKILRIFGPLAAIAIAVWFESAFLGFKLALTVIVPIMTTYGLAVAVYQMGMLNWLGIDMLMGTGGLDFRIIILTAGLLFGFAMDYGLFLVIRVYEYRLAGYDNLSAVKRSLVETGPVITTAGTMMICSFFCIMCSRTVFLRTMGFIFVVGVSFDVFVIRTMIAPVFLIIGEGLNYWPREMPVPVKSWDGPSPASSPTVQSRSPQICPQRCKNSLKYLPRGTKPIKTCKWDTAPCASDEVVKEPNSPRSPLWISIYTSQTEQQPLMAA
jgi:predicted RND superfamily exporter protein